MRNIIAALALVLGAASAFGQAADTESTVTYVYGSGSSYNFCFNNGSTSVSCNANCQVRCEIPDQNVEVTE